MKNDHVAQAVAVYDSIADQYASNIENIVVPSERGKFLSFIPEGGYILDAGCAAGRDSQFFDAKGFKVTGVDLSSKLLELARAKAPTIDFQQQDIRKLNFSKDTFDGIYAPAVLLHLGRDEIVPTIRQFYSLLKPEGVLYILVKEGIGEASVVDSLSAGRSRHFTYFEQREMQDYLKQAGFKTSHTYRFNEKDINPNWRDVVWISALAQKPK